jgi:molybdopterin-guanine dinucleotide biosynthesis protein B
MVLIVAAIGKSGTGKTVTLEYLIKQFSDENYKVGAIKHIHHKDFTIDTKGKNTWRYAQAGAKVIVAMAPNEIAIIKKTTQETDNIEQIIKTLKEEKEDIDIIFVEGYHDLMAKKVDVVKIITVEDEEMLLDTLEKTVEPVVAISGLITKNTKMASIQGYPVIKIPEEGRQLVELIKKYLIIQKD